MTGSIKNPDNEATTPARVPRDGSKPNMSSGPKAQGNDRGELKQDPEGQQAGEREGSKNSSRSQRQMGQYAGGPKRR